MDLFVTAIPGSFNVELVERQPPNTNFSTGMPLVFRPSPRIRTVRNPFNSVFRLVRTHSPSVLPFHPYRRPIHPMLICDPSAHLFKESVLCVNSAGV